MQVPGCSSPFYENGQIYEENENGHIYEETENGQIYEENTY